MRFEIRLRAVATRPQPSRNFLKTKQISVRVSFFFPSSPQESGAESSLRRATRRAEVLLLLDSGWSCQEVASTFLLGDGARLAQVV